MSDLTERRRQWICARIGHRWSYQIEGPVKFCLRCGIATNE